MDKPPRKRVETANPNVSLYHFADAGEIPKKIADDLERYIELHDLSRVWYDMHGVEMRESAPELIEEMRGILIRLKEHDKKVIEQSHKSVLSYSHAPGELIPWRRGADSHVYRHESERYVFKYSVYSQEASPEAVEYLRKKYTLLNKFLGKHIPQSAFFLGDYKKAFDKHKPEGSFLNVLRLITIQRRIKGKSFQEMTPEERTSKDVLDALKEAHKKYAQAKMHVEKINIEYGKQGFGVDLQLDIGNISDKYDLNDTRVVAECKSPNIIYSDEEKKVYFIDFGGGVWSNDKEEVFRELMKS